MGEGTGPSAEMVRRVPWRSVLRRHIALLVAAKFAALILLWALFFSPTHRTHVDSRAAGEHLAATAEGHSRD